MSAWVAFDAAVIIVRGYPLTCAGATLIGKICECVLVLLAELSSPYECLMPSGYSMVEDGIRLLPRIFECEEVWNGNGIAAVFRFRMHYALGK